MGETMNKTNGKDSNPFTASQLNEALYALWAMMDTYWYEWYVTHDTARAIRDKKPLSGNKVTGAMHKRHVNQEFKSVIKKYLENWAKHPMWGDKQLVDSKIEDYTFDDEGITFTYKGIPVELKFIDRKYAFFNNPDIVYYEYNGEQLSDDFRVANPFEGYWKARFIVR